MLIFNIPYRLLLFLCLTPVLIGCCLWIWFINIPILEDLEARGEAAQAEVTWVGEPYWVWRRGNHSRGGWRIDMRYGFRTKAGRWVEGEDTFVKQNAKRLKVGRTFDVRYLPDDPAIHHSAYVSRYAGIGGIYVLIPMSAVCGFMTLFYWRRRPANWQGPKLWPPLSSG